MEKIEEQSNKFFKEKIWTKIDGKETVADGYSFRGKRVFKKAWDGLKEHFVKGIQYERDNILYKAHDVREIGTGMEADVEVIEKGDRGVAKLKLYGQNTRKENSITISKSREGDHTQITTLAEKIVKPLMNSFINENKEGEDITEVDEFKCNFCDKTSLSNQGLKSHVTKVHSNQQNNFRKTVANKRKSKDEFESRVEKSLEDGANKNHLSCIKESIIEEMETEPEHDKMYANRCDECDFEVEASRKYLSVQKILRHKESCTKYLLCKECRYLASDKNNLRRHMRDAHNSLSGALSPPQKKKKNQKNEEKSLQSEAEVEEMEIDSIETESAEKMEIKEMSDLMDDKIITRENKRKEEEYNREKRKKQEQLEKMLEKEIQINIIEKEKKQKKQKIKNEKKKKKQTQTKISEVPNLSPVPENCKQFVNEDDLLYLVPGDGNCAPNCAAAFLFNDEIYGTQLRRVMNVFFVDHWHKRYKYITQCSEGFPFVRKVGGGGEIRFTDPEKLLNYLKHSEEAAFIWSDSEDLSIISDIYQIKIKVITTKGTNDKSPTVNWIFPDESLKVFSEFTKVEMNDMTLLHENDMHFNLVISKNSDLAKLGSLSYRYNVGPLLKRNEEEKDKKEKEDNVKDKDTEIVEKSQLNKDIKDLKTKLELSEEKRKELLEKYLKFEKKYTEDTEKLKTEIKDLTEMLKLNGKMDDKTTKKSEETYADVVKKSSIIEKGEEKEFNCMECCFQGTEKSELSRHIYLKHIKTPTKVSINCKYCGEVFGSNSHLNDHVQSEHVKSVINNRIRGETFTTGRYQNNHINSKHRDGTSINCRVCGEEFLTKQNLMEHRKMKHIESVAYCKNKLQEKCPYTDQRCWWNHNEKYKENINCFICGETFDNKNEMMKHRKRNHSHLIKPCNAFSQNKCRFKDDLCWFKHQSEDQLKDNTEELEEEKKDDYMEKVFREVSEDLDPPIVHSKGNLE